MLTNRRANFILNLTGNIDRRSAQYARSIERMEGRSTRAFKTMGRGALAFNRQLSRLSNRYTTLFTGASAAAAGRFVVNLDDDLAHLGERTQWNAQQVKAFKEEIFDIAQNPKYRIKPEQSFAAFDKIITDLGNPDIALKNLENMAALMRAFRVEGEAAGGVVGNIAAKFKLTGADGIAQAIAFLAGQGDIGSFEVKDLAQFLPEVGSAFVTQTQRDGMQGLTEVGTLLQVTQRLTNNSAESFNWRP